MAKTLAMVFGIIFVLLGVLGFVPNPLISADGLFVVNTMHNLIHLVTGLILLGVAFMAADKSGLWLKILGVVYLLLAVLGFVMMPSGGTLLGADMNMSDHWLHVVLGVVLVAAGFMAKDSSAHMPTGMAAGPSM